MEKWYVVKDGLFLKKDNGAASAKDVSWVGDAVVATPFYLKANAVVWARKTDGIVLESKN